MLTIPTAEFAGCIADALNFISPDKEALERRCVHLHWDGEMFHASASSDFHCGISSWGPDDAPSKPVQGELGVELGSADDEWQLVLSAEDATHLLNACKTPKGLEYVNLFVGCDDEILTVKRAKMIRLPGFVLAYDDMGHPFPDLRAEVVEAAHFFEATKQLHFNPMWLESFAKVRSRGYEMELTLAGPERAAVVRFGPRFIGAVHPVRMPANQKSEG